MIHIFVLIYESQCAGRNHMRRQIRRLYSSPGSCRRFTRRLLRKKKVLVIVMVQLLLTPKEFFEWKSLITVPWHRNDLDWSSSHYTEWAQRRLLVLNFIHNYYSKLNITKELIEEKKTSSKKNLKVKNLLYNNRNRNIMVLWDLPYWESMSKDTSKTSYIHTFHNREDSECSGSKPCKPIFKNIQKI